RYRDADGLRVRNHDAVAFLHVNRFLDGFADRPPVGTGALHGLAGADVDRYLARARHGFTHGARGALLARLIVANIHRHLTRLLNLLADRARGGALTVLIVTHVDGDLARLRDRFADRAGAGALLVLVVAHVDGDLA